MNNAESEGFSAFAEDGDIKTRIEEFIADAQKLQQSYAVALPLLKLLDTLFIVLAVIQRKDGQMLIQIYYEDAHNPSKNNGYHADICRPDELGVQRIAGLIEKSHRALLEEYPQNAEAPPGIVILRLSLALILNQLEN